MLGRYTTGPLQRMRRIAGDDDLVPCRPGVRRRLGPRLGALSDLYSAVMSPIDLRSDTVTHRPTRCAGPWPRPRSATTSSATIPRSAPSRNERPSCSARRPGSSSPAGPRAISWPSWPTSPAVRRRSPGGSGHMVMDEAAGHAVVVGTSIAQLAERPDGTMDPAEIEEAFRDPSDAHEPITGLVAIENTHAHSMGQPLTAAYTAEVAAIAHAPRRPAPRRRGALLQRRGGPRGPADRAGRTGRHGDLLPEQGAGLPESARWSSGRGSTIRRARRGRKLVGGGLRQVGILAAAGLVALRDGPDGMIERLAEDHANARRLAEGLAAMDGIVAAGGIAQPEPGPLDPGRVRTDFVIFRVERSRAVFLDGLRARNVVMVRLSAWSGPRRHPLRRERGRHRDRPGRRDRRPARDGPAPAGRTDGRRPGRPSRRTRVTQPSIEDFPLPRPGSAADRGPLDDRFYELVEARFRRVIARPPDFATFIGIHAEDRPPRGRRARCRPRRDRRGAGAIWPRSRRSIRPASHRSAASSGTSRSTTSDGSIFDADVASTLGAPIDRSRRRRRPALRRCSPATSRPLTERLDAMASRMEAVPAFLEHRKSRAVVPRSGCGRTIEIETAERDAARCSTRSWPPARAPSATAEQRRLDAAADGGEDRRGRLSRAGSRGTLADGTDELGARPRALRRAGRPAGLRRARRRRDPRDRPRAARPEQGGVGWRRPGRSTRTSTRPTVVDRIKRDHPATFEEALDGLPRRHGPGPPAPHRARHRDASPPMSGSRSSRPPSTSATSSPSRPTSSPPKFDTQPDRASTSSRPRSATTRGAMREHNFSSISNTSIHEAYPGHHLQLAVAAKHPSR